MNEKNIKDIIEKIEELNSMKKDILAKQLREEQFAIYINGYLDAAIYLTTIETLKEVLVDYKREKSLAELR